MKIILIEIKHVPMIIDFQTKKRNARTFFLKNIVYYKFILFDRTIFLDYTFIKDKRSHFAEHILLLRGTFI